jgi:valyl-tRNA synthetase
VLRELLKLLHPVMPFITEELWERMGFADGTMLMLAPWPALPPSFADEAASAELNWIVRLISRVRALRSEYDMAPSAQVALEIVGLEPAHRASLARNEALVQRLANAAIATEEQLAKAVEDVFEEARLRLAVGAVDRAQAARQVRAPDRQGREGGREPRRAPRQPELIAKADPEAIEDLRERRVAEHAACTGYQQALERLKKL